MYDLDDREPPDQRPDARPVAQGQPSEAELQEEPESWLLEWASAAERVGVDQGLTLPQLDRISALLAPALGTPGGSEPPSRIRLARYERIALLGEGGMGVVHRCRDQAMGREVAVKTLRPGAERGRFLREALLTAHLQHPCVVPVYEIGEEGDPPWYAMGLVEGRSFDQVIAEARGTGDPTWSLHRLVSVVRDACEAIAHAHERGIVHRDLKPQNLMIATNGSTYVVDWGLARRVAAWVPEDRPLLEHLDSLRGAATGALGTTGYCAPEQTDLERPVNSTPEAADVYGLGACLHHALTGGPPSCAAPRTSLEGGTAARLPEGTPAALAELCAASLSQDPASRPSARTLADALRAWLDGSQRRARAGAMLTQALLDLGRSEHLEKEAEQRAALGERLLSALNPWDPPDLKAPAWRAEHEAAALAEESMQLHAAALARLEGALELDGDYAEARRLLADDALRRYQAADARGDRREAGRMALRLERYDAERHATHVRGEAHVHLALDAPQARVELQRYHPQRSRLWVPESVSPALETPHIDLPLPAGSWRARLTAAGRAPVDVCFTLRARDRWPAPAPGETSPRPVALPPVGAIGSGDCYVPAGWYLAGEALTPTWIEGFVIKRHPITNAEYILFLNDLVRRGADPHTLQEAPRERGRGPEDPGVMIYAWDPEGQTFVLKPDHEGDPWLPDYPVVMISWHAAAAYCAWLAEREGLPWRLPYELEWEKAARGGDGRAYPWGNDFDASLACVRASRAPGSDGAPARVDELLFSSDESPYGVRGMAGNTSDWCQDMWHPAGALRPGEMDPHTPWAKERDRVVRGGHWYSEPRPLTWRTPVNDLNLMPTLGVRPARPWPVCGG